jgi:hypothetical protein
LSITASSTLATSSQRSVASSRNGERIALVVEQLHDRLLVGPVGLVLEAVDLDRERCEPLVAAERAEGEADLLGRRGDDVRQLAGAGSDRRQPVQADDSGRRVDRVHHVVERARELEDAVGQEVALVLDLLDLFGLVPDRPVGRQHLLEQAGAVLQLVGERLEVAEELLLARDQSEGQAARL